VNKRWTFFCPTIAEIIGNVLGMKEREKGHAWWQSIVPKTLKQDLIRKCVICFGQKKQGGGNKAGPI